MNINEFKSALKHGGARNNLFRVRLTNPIDNSADSILPFLCHSTALPTKKIEHISLSYFGRNAKVAGHSTSYDDWQISIFNDEDFKIRNALETWQNAINSPEGNTRRLSGSQPNLYKATAEVIQMSQTGAELRTYKMIGIWPVSMSEITMDWASDEVQKFTVTFSVDYWHVAENSPTGNAGGPV